MNSYKMASIKQELKDTYWFTDVRYGIAYDVMRPNNLDFLGDAFKVECHD